MPGKILYLQHQSGMQKITSLFIGLLFILSCRTYHPTQVQWSEYHLEQKKSSVDADSVANSTIQPYKNALDSQMHVVIGRTITSLKAGKPEGTLGDFFADAIREQTSAWLHAQVDISFFNSGGLRIPEIPTGNIQVTTIYELMPFDNEAVILELDGKTVLQICEFSAKRGGDPVSGMRYQIRDNAPVNILVGNEALDLNRKYMVATNDYLANGGDNLNFLKGKPIKQTGIKIRDMLLDYFKTHDQPLNYKPDGRVQLQK